LRRTVLLAVAAHALACSPPVKAFDQSLEPLLARLEALRIEHEVPGFALTLVSDEQGLQTGSGGVADRGSGRRVTADTLFRIGSITKTFNALAVLMLIEQGRLRLETPLRELVPQAPLENPWADDDPVRVAHLLEHSSGLLDITREEFDHNTPFATLDAAFAFRPGARRVQWPPGLHFVYSNANAGLVGLLIERLSGQNYARFITERLLRPLGMRSAGLSGDALTRRRLATGYDSDGTTPIPYWHMIFPPLGAINATPREMGALVEFFLRRGRVGDQRLLEAASVDRMENPATTLAARHGLSYGYGPGLRQSLHNGFRWYGHGGDGDGYLSHFAYNREANAGYFLVINAFKYGALRAMKQSVQDHLTQGLSQPQPPASDVAIELLRPLTGTYVAVTRRFAWLDPLRMQQERLRVVLEDGGLYTRRAGGRRLLIPVSARLFRREGQSFATIAFAAHRGELYLQADFGNYRKVER
jgi:CubicO group peptidase (beta-lactamase class C family)